MGSWVVHRRHFWHGPHFLTLPRIEPSAKGIFTLVNKTIEYVHGVGMALVFVFEKLVAGKAAKADFHHAFRPFGGVPVLKTSGAVAADGGA